MSTPKIGNIEKLPFDQRDVGAKGRAMQSFGNDMSRAGDVLAHMQIQKQQKQDAKFKSDVDVEYRPWAINYLSTSQGDLAKGIAPDPSMLKEEAYKGAHEAFFGKFKPESPEQQEYLDSFKKSSFVEFSAKANAKYKAYENERVLNDTVVDANSLFGHYTDGTMVLPDLMKGWQNLWKRFGNSDLTRAHMQKTLVPLMKQRLMSKSMTEEEAEAFMPYMEGNHRAQVLNSWERKTSAANNQGYLFYKSRLKAGNNEYRVPSEEDWKTWQATKAYLESGDYVWTEAKTEDFLLEYSKAEQLYKIYHGDPEINYVGHAETLSHTMKTYVSGTRLRGEDFSKENYIQELEDSKSHFADTDITSSSFSVSDKLMLRMINNEIAKAKQTSEVELLRLYDDDVDEVVSGVDSSRNLYESTLLHHSTLSGEDQERHVSRVKEAKDSYDRMSTIADDFIAENYGILSMTEEQLDLFKSNLADPSKILTNVGMIKEMSGKTTNWARQVEMMGLEPTSSLLLKLVPFAPQKDYQKGVRYASRLTELLSLSLNNQNPKFLDPAKQVSTDLLAVSSIKDQLHKIFDTRGTYTAHAEMEPMAQVMLMLDADYIQEAERYIELNQDLKNDGERKAALVEKAKESFEKVREHFYTKVPLGIGDYVMHPNNSPDLTLVENQYLDEVVATLHNHIPKNPDILKDIERGSHALGAYILDNLWTEEEFDNYIEIKGKSLDRTPEELNWLRDFKSKYGDFLNFEITKGQTFSSFYDQQGRAQTAMELNKLYTFIPAKDGNWEVHAKGIGRDHTPALLDNRKMIVSWQEVASWGDRADDLIGRHSTPYLKYHENRPFFVHATGSTSVMSMHAYARHDDNLSFKNRLFDLFSRNEASMHNVLHKIGDYNMPLKDLGERVTLAPFAEGDLIVDKEPLVEAGFDISLAERSNFVAIYDNQTRTNTGFIYEIDGGSIDDAMKIWDRYDRHGSFFSEGSQNPNDLSKVDQFDRGHMVASSMAFINAVRHAKTQGLQGEELENYMNKEVPEVIKQTYFGGNITAENSHFNQFFKRSHENNMRAMFSLLGLRGVVMQGYLPASNKVDIGSMSNPSMYYSYALADIDGELVPVSAYVADQSARFKSDNLDYFKYGPQGSLLENEEQDLKKIQQILFKHVGNPEELIRLEMPSEALIKE